MRIWPNAFGLEYTTAIYAVAASTCARYFAMISLGAVPISRFKIKYNKQITPTCRTRIEFSCCFLPTFAFIPPHGATAIHTKLMFNSISWQQYITVVTLLSILWYLFVAFRYYRPEIAARLNIRRSSRPALVAYPSVMGPVKTDYETTASEELRFGASQPDDISDSSLPAGPTDELLAQTQTLIQAFTDTPIKPEFLSLLGVLLSKYEPYEDEIDLKALRPLAAQLPFAIEEQEWPTFKN